MLFLPQNLSFIFLLGHHFDYPGSGSVLPIRIRIQRKPFQFGSTWIRIRNTERNNSKEKQTQVHYYGINKSDIPILVYQTTLVSHYFDLRRDSGKYINRQVGTYRTVFKQVTSESELWIRTYIQYRYTDLDPALLAIYGSGSRLYCIQINFFLDFSEHFNFVSF